ncbi:hypothetical protein V1478_012430 [Vespula squamosa]|uniref:Uncharacterized protein n=1 Tax=Vespula squamosa TaxID=30214 RepID=A0ABD2AD54_VESSQ
MNGYSRSHNYLALPLCLSRNVCGDCGMCIVYETLVYSDRFFWAKLPMRKSLWQNRSYVLRIALTSGNSLLRIVSRMQKNSWQMVESLTWFDTLAYANATALLIV